MQHYFINSDSLNLTTWEVTIVEDAFHIANVMRMTVGERIVVIAADSSYLVELTNINPKMCVGQIIEELSFDNELKTKVTIAHAFVRREKQEDTIEKITELGAYAYMPVIMERCNVKIDLDKQDKKRTRIEKIIKEASEQSHRTSLMKLYDVCSFKALLKQSQNYDLCLVCDTTTNPYDISSIVNDDNIKNVLVLIGPEGGISENELKQLENNNFKKISLGKRILRTEVAPLFVMSIFAGSEEIL